MSRQLFTLGYEGIPAEEFVRILRAAGVEKVIDVREVPLSRKPGFSKRQLAARLEEGGLKYGHVVEMGCPKPVRDQFRVDGDWARYTRGFRKHLAQQRGEVARLAAESMTTRLCLICYEADYLDCHRSYVAEAISTLTCANVVHLSLKKDPVVLKAAA